MKNGRLNGRPFFRIRPIGVPLPMRWAPHWPPPAPPGQSSPEGSDLALPPGRSGPGPPCRRTPADRAAGGPAAPPAVGGGRTEGRGAVRPPPLPAGAGSHSRPAPPPPGLLPHGPPPEGRGPPGPRYVPCGRRRPAAPPVWPAADPRPPPIGSVHVSWRMPSVPSDCSILFHRGRRVTEPPP